MSSILTTVPVLDDQLKAVQWFDVEKYPDATFTSTKVTPIEEDRATITGNLTLHNGVRKPVRVESPSRRFGQRPTRRSFVVGFEAVATINRSDFGIKQYLPLVGDDVALRIAGGFVLGSSAMRNLEQRDSLQPVTGLSQQSVDQEMRGPMIDLMTAPYAALLLRWSLGIMFIAHALLHWRVLTMPVVAMSSGPSGCQDGSRTWSPPPN